MSTFALHATMTHETVRREMPACRPLGLSPRRHRLSLRPTPAADPCGTRGPSRSPTWPRPTLGRDTFERNPIADLGVGRLTSLR